MSIKCHNCGYERPPNTKEIGTECPICETPYPESAKSSETKTDSALTNCKDCKKEVSKTASTCPHCGVSNPGITSKEIGQGCLVIVVIAIILSVVLNTCSSEDDSSRNPAAGGEEIMAFVMCKTPVEKQLRAPSTAKFASMSSDGVSSTHIGGGVYNVRGYVDAQNGFGAMIRTNWICKIKENPDKTWSLIDLQM